METSIPDNCSDWCEHDWSSDSDGHPSVDKWRCYMTGTCFHPDRRHINSADRHTSPSHRPRSIYQGEWEIHANLVPDRERSLLWCLALTNSVRLIDNDQRVGRIESFQRGRLYVLPSYNTVQYSIFTHRSWIMYFNFEKSVDNYMCPDRFAP